MANAPMGTTAETGQLCPGGGLWQLKGDSSVTIGLRQDERMPPHDGQHVVWELMRTDDPLPADYAQQKERIRRG